MGVARVPCFLPKKVLSNSKMLCRSTWTPGISLFWCIFHQEDFRSVEDKVSVNTREAHETTLDQAGESVFGRRFDHCHFFLL